MTLLVLALAAFVGSHFLLSHPLRAPLVARLGGGGFTARLFARRLRHARLGGGRVESRAGRPVVDAPAWAWPLAAVVMLLACILFVGSVTAPNPALVGMPASAAAAAPRGVQRITRHPMMWAFALWAVVHGGLAGSGRTVALAGAVLILALVGAHLQDGKKRAQLGPAWASHEAATSFVPFGRGLAMPGWTALVGGIVLFLVATGVHPLAGGPNL